jgi:hypothetical protein
MSRWATYLTHRRRQRPTDAVIRSRSDDADDNADVLSKRHYLTDLNEYFKLKNAYETSYRQKKKVFRSALLKGNTTKHSKKTAVKSFPCVNCSAVGGTSFRKKDGSTLPFATGSRKCNLNIKIFTGVHYNFDDLVLQTRSSRTRSRRS